MTMKGWRLAVCPDCVKHNFQATVFFVDTLFFKVSGEPKLECVRHGTVTPEFISEADG